MGFNRYSLVLLMLAGGTVAATAGCTNSSGSRGGNGSTVAPTTSSKPAPVATSVAPTTTVTAPKGPGPRFAQAAWEDKDGDGRASKGDLIRITFDREIAFQAAKLDATVELELAVPGDDLGKGATVEADAGNKARAVVTLGDQPSIHIAGVHTASVNKKGSPSGVNLSTKGQSKIVDAKDQVVAKPATAPCDIDGNAKIGFRNASNMVAPRGAHEAVLLDDGRVLVVGGMNDGRKGVYSEEAEIYDPIANTWTLVSTLSGKAGRMYGSDGKTVVKRIRATATKLKDGTVLIAGGYGTERKGFFGLGSPVLEVLDDAHLFDPKTNTFSRVGELKNSRQAHSATLLSDGRVVIAGGYSTAFFTSFKTLAPFELYDPKTKKFSEEKTFPIFFFPAHTTVEKRMDHAAIELPDGVLLAGGEHWVSKFFGSATRELCKGSEVFKTKGFSKSGNLNHPRRFPSGAHLGSSNVLLAGGHDDKGFVTTCETWDVTGKWTKGPAVPTSRTASQIAVLGDEAFLVGGFGTKSNALRGEVKKVDVYSADTKKFGTGYELGVGRAGCTATVLADGRILVAGGFTGVINNVLGLDGTATPATEIFVKP
ncbi:MAG: kelch repeat-containing protein [Planctomycetota bacterium]